MARDCGRGAWRTFAATLVIWFGLGAGAPLASQQAAPPSVELPADLDRVLRDYERAWTARDAVALADLFAPDGFVMRPGRPPARGREAILDAYRGSGGPLALRAFHLEVRGEIGYILGGFARQQGEPDIGKFVLTLRRDETGRWRITADLDNGNGPPGGGPVA